MLFTLCIDIRYIFIIDGKSNVDDILIIGCTYPFTLSPSKRVYFFSKI